MSIINKKKESFNKIKTTKTLNNGIPKISTKSSMPSVNNKGDVITFLTDLIKVLVGFQELVSTVVETLTNALPKVEKGIKTALKTELKSIVSCGVDPSIPDWIKSTGTGIVIEVKKIDFLDMLKTDPNSVAGKLTYNDVTTPLTDSTDFNTFLYEVIQNPTVTYAWPQQNSVLNITFNELGVGGNPNNTLTIKADPAYDTKTLTDLNNDFVDSLQLINSANVLNKIMDIIYGTVSSVANKAINLLEKEQEINGVVDKMVNNINKGPIPDSEFAFSNEEKVKQQAEAAARKRGTTNIKTFTGIASTIPIESLTTYNQQLSNATSVTQKKEVIDTNIKNLSNLSVENVSNLDDKISGKLNFIQEIIQSMIKSIVGIILSPKVILVFLINYKIVYGQNNTPFLDPIDFIKKNKNLITGIVKAIASELIKILLTIALKEISVLVSKSIAKKQTEKNANRLAQLQTLIGVPLNIIRGLLNNLL
jgi:hypothetical protein